MIAMQYRIVLPDHYPMASIEARIAANGHRLDGYPGLLFKAFLYRRRDDWPYEGAQNCYAPFYLWRQPQAMAGFLAGDGFAALCRDFGRPRVDSWQVPEGAFPPATTAFVAINHRGQGDLVGLDPATGQGLGVQWLNRPPAGPEPGVEHYRLGYLAVGA